MSLTNQLTVEWLGRVGYAEALAMQDALVERISLGDEPERLLLLEHDAIYTIGRTRDTSSLRDPALLPHPVLETNRGGQATWHGPGQLVGYPLLDLRSRGRDLHVYLRALEDVLIAALAVLQIDAGRREGLTGVWVQDRKIASIGVGVRKWVTMHGFALNVCGELSGFDAIVPCGIADVRMTAVERESGRATDVEAVAATVATCFREVFEIPRSG